MFKKIACASLAVFVLFAGQANGQAAVVVVGQPIRDLEAALKKAGLVTAAGTISAEGNRVITQSLGAMNICTAAQLQVATDAQGLLENIASGVLGGVGIPLVLQNMDTLSQSKTLSDAQKTILFECKKVLDAKGSLITKLTAAVTLAATGGGDPYSGAMTAIGTFTNDINAVIKNVNDAILLTKEEKIAAEQKKSRQLIQFDQILKKITERMKLALTEKIKSTILDTLQNSGAPRWITNWSTRYANKYMNAYQQKYQEVYLEETQKREQGLQKIINRPPLPSDGPPSVSIGNPGGPLDKLNRLQQYRWDILASMQIHPLFLATGKGAAAGENAEAAQKQEDIASSGYESDFECVPTGGVNESNTINVPNQGTFAAAFNKKNGLASNYNLLQIRDLKQVALLSTQNLNDNGARPIGGVNVNGIDTNSSNASFANTITAKDCPPGYEKKVVTPGGTYADMSKELMGIDIKQMLNNTIEEWMNSFLENSIICKISGTTCGKTANIGDIAKRQLLGQLSNYGNSLNEDNPAKDLIAQIVEQEGSLDGIFGSSERAQESRDQLSQYGNSLPSGDPMKETIDQIVSAGNNSNDNGGTLSDISVGGDTGQSSGKIDCSTFRGSAKTDCETAASLFDSNKELQKQMLDEAIKNLDMPGRLSRATENLNTISTKLNQIKTIYEDIAKCATDNQQLAKDTVPLVEEMIEDSEATKAMLQNVQDSIDQFKNSSPEKLETLMENESQFLESIDATMTEIESTNIPRYFTSIRTWLSQIVKFNTALKIEVEGVVTTIPAGINVTNGCQQSPFTTDTSGTLFVQTLTQKEYTLQDFFSAWGKTFNQTQLFNLPPADAFRDLTMFVNNATSTEFQALKLQGSQNILIKYTTKPAGTCVNGRLIDGSLCPVQQQACRNNVLNPPTCAQQPGQTCTPISLIPGSSQLLCS